MSAEHECQCQKEPDYMVRLEARGGGPVVVYIDQASERGDVVLLLRELSEHLWQHWEEVFPPPGRTLKEEV